MNIQDILAKNVGNYTAWVDYGYGMSFNIRYLPKGELHTLSKASTNRKYDPDKKQHLTVIDPEVFSRKFCEKVVLGWRGVTPNNLANLVPVDLDKVPEDKRDAELTYSLDNMVEIFRQAYQVDDFLQTCSIDLALFRPTLETETKNSKPSQTGS